MRSARFVSESFGARLPAWGPMIRRGYAGKIQTGVIWEMVKVWVDHLRKLVWGIGG